MFRIIGLLVISVVASLFFMLAFLLFRGALFDTLLPMMGAWGYVLYAGVLSLGLLFMYMRYRWILQGPGGLWWLMSKLTILLLSISFSIVFWSLVSNLTIASAMIPGISLGIFIGTFLSSTFQKKWEILFHEAEYDADDE